MVLINLISADMKLLCYTVVICTGLITVLLNFIFIRLGNILTKIK